MFLHVCLSTGGGGGCYPSMHCRWYPSMPCSRSPGGGIPACLAGLQAHNQGGSSGGSGQGGLQAHTQGGSWGGSSLGGFSRPTPGGPAPRAGVCSRGCGDPPPVTVTAAGGTHPTGMHSCLLEDPPPGTDIWWPPKHVRLVRGRYASYWNAFLFYFPILTWFLTWENRLIFSALLLILDLCSERRFYVHQTVHRTRRLEIIRLEKPLEET